MANTLGGIIQVVYNTLRENCLKRETIRQLNRGSNALCCNIPELENPENYGCPKTTRKPYRKNRPRLRRTYPKKRAYRNNKKKYFRKKKQTPQKYCSKGKKKCVCWLYSEEGHYANECPKKNEKENKDRMKVINEVLKIHNLEPLEDELSNMEYNIYEYSSDELSS